MRREEGIIESIVGIFIAIILFSSLANVFADPSFSTGLNKLLISIIGISIVVMIIAVVIKIIEKFQDVFY